MRTGNFQKQMFFFVANLEFTKNPESGRFPQNTGSDREKGTHDIIRVRAEKNPKHEIPKKSTKTYFSCDQDLQNAKNWSIVRLLL